MKPKALLKKVICEKIEEEHKTSGGILLPDSHTKDQEMYLIISKGDAVDESLKVGDKVVVSGFQGFSINCEGKEYKAFEEDQILAVVED